MQREMSLGRKRRLLLCTREKAFAKKLATDTPPAVVQAMVPALRALFGTEESAPSRSAEAVLIRSIRRGLRARLVSEGIVPETSPRCGWRLHHNPVWAAVRDHQSAVFAMAASLGGPSP